jgi:hypothetical protein
VVADHAVLAVHRNAGKVAHMLVGAVWWERGLD